MKASFSVERLLVVATGLSLLAACNPAPPGGAVRVRPADHMPMVYAPAGEFVMGSTLEMSRLARKLCEQSAGDLALATCQPAAFVDERPAHVVSLRDFWIDQTEVTNGMYLLCVDATACQVPLLPSSSSRNAYFAAEEYAAYPVLNVRWDMAAEYCAWAGARLPTEAEWEYAARGPESRIFPWGNDFEAARLNYCDAGCPLLADAASEDGYPDTAPVGAFPAGASWIGALDMSGNAREWVSDWFGTYPSAAATDPRGPGAGELKIVRGGSWYDTPDDVRNTNRGGELPDYWRDNLGFRCAQDAE